MVRMKLTKNPESIPAKMQEIFEELTSLTNGFCSQYLDEEYAEVIRKALAALCRKRVSPLQSGHAQTWAAGVVHAICMVNFGFDKSQQPSISAKDLCTYFKRAQSTISNKSQEIRRLLKMGQWDHHWMLPSRIADSSLAWMVSFNGFIIDARKLPRHIQEEAAEKGFIPYLPE